MCSGKMDASFGKSRLEALPQELLVKVLCGIDHEDLKQLFHVSKTIRGATLIAKKWHFEYNTPKKQTSVFLDLNAPLRTNKSRRTWRKKLARISVALFASAEDY